MTHRNRFAIAASVIIGLTSTLGHALEADKLAQVQWEAKGNSTMVQEGDTRTLSMENEVVITQGSLRIEGDSAQFDYAVASNELRLITVTGNPVRYSQTLSEAGDRVEATSNSLRLFTEARLVSEANGSTSPGSEQSIVELIGEATIDSPDSSMRCAAIVYLVDADLIREATGPCSGSLANSPTN